MGGSYARAEYRRRRTSLVTQSVRFIPKASASVSSADISASLSRISNRRVARSRRRAGPDLSPSSASTVFMTRRRSKAERPPALSATASKRWATSSSRRKVKTGMHQGYCHTSPASRLSGPHLHSTHRIVCLSRLRLYLAKCASHALSMEGRRQRRRPGSDLRKRAAPRLG